MRLAVDGKTCRLQSRRWHSDNNHNSKAVELKQR